MTSGGPEEPAQSDEVPPKAQLIESELLLQTPRKVQIKKERGGNLAFVCVVLVFLPFILAGIVLFVNTTHDTFLINAGRVTMAEVVNREVVAPTIVGEKCRVTYEYHVGLMKYTASDDVDRNECDDDNLIGKHVAVFYLTEAPGWRSRLRDGGLIVRKVGILWGITFYWNVNLALIIWLILRHYNPLRALVVWGSSVVATIVSKPMEDFGEYCIFRLEYEFTPLDDSMQKHLPIRISKRVHQYDWQSMDIGDQITVLYSPDDPQKNSLYCFSPFLAKP